MWFSKRGRARKAVREMMVLEAGGMIGGRPVQYRGHRYTLSYMVERKKVPNKKNRAQSRKKNNDKKNKI